MENKTKRGKKTENLTHGPLLFAFKVAEKVSYLIIPYQLPFVAQKKKKLVWRNRHKFATPPLVSPRNDVWETSIEIPYWWRGTTQISIVLLIDHAAWDICLNQSEALVSLQNDVWETSAEIPSWWHVTSDMSSGWNFCACFSDIILQGNQWRRRKMSALSLFVS